MDLKSFFLTENDSFDGVLGLLESFLLMILLVFNFFVFSRNFLGIMWMSTRAFHLNNREVRCDPHIQVNGKLLPFFADPLLRRKPGQSSHLSPIHGITSQKANISCCSFEGTGMFRLGSRC